MLQFFQIFSIAGLFYLSGTTRVKTATYISAKSYLNLKKDESFSILIHQIYQ